MHSRGVAHHDLKQTNVMIAEAIDLTDSIHLLEYKLQTVTFKLIDMGLARRYPIERGLAIREDTYIKGTALFCSAEKFAAPRLSYNPYLSDCYSLGVVLFWALLGSKAIKEQLRIQGARGCPERQAPTAVEPKGARRCTTCASSHSTTSRARNISIPCGSNFEPNGVISLC